MARLPEGISEAAVIHTTDRDSPHDARRTVQRDDRILDGEQGDSFPVAQDVAQIARVSCYIGRRAMREPQRVEVRAGRRAARREIARRAASLISHAWW